MRQDTTQAPAMYGHDAADAPAPCALLQAGRNCRSVSRAETATVLVDGAQYFARLDECLEEARRSIVIVGWDFDASVRLRPDADGSGTTLGDRLRSLVEAHETLEIHILIWSFAVAHAPSHGMSLLFGDDWQDHPRIHLKLDRTNRFYASHHQKIVLVDGVLAFVGGIDLTVGRWDTQEHCPADERRVEADGSKARPVHDCQVALTGPVVGDLLAIAAERWQRATGEAQRFAGPATGPIAGQPDRSPDFRHVPAGIAVTDPGGGWRGPPPVRHAAWLTVDALRSAGRMIYIENQYFAGALARTILPELLEAPDGPEIVVVTTRSMNGFVEQLSEGTNRDRLLRHLKRFDRHDRLRVFHPMQGPVSDPDEIFIHSKILVADDGFLRVGSTNFNNRSVGVDTECDLGLVADTPEHRAAIRTIMARLVGEHLGVDPATVLETLAETGSLIRTIDRLNGGDRRLVGFPALASSGPRRPQFGTRLLDPIAPFGTAAWWRGRFSCS